MQSEGRLSAVGREFQHPYPGTEKDTFGVNFQIRMPCNSEGTCSNMPVALILHSKKRLKA